VLYPMIAIQSPPLWMETIASREDSERSFETVFRDYVIDLYSDHIHDLEILAGILGQQYQLF